MNIHWCWNTEDDEWETDAGFLIVRRSPDYGVLDQTGDKVNGTLVFTGDLDECFDFVAEVIKANVD